VRWREWGETVDEAADPEPLTQESTYCAYLVAAGHLQHLPYILRFSSDPGQKVRHLRKPGQNQQSRSCLAGGSTGVASFDRDFLIGIIQTGFTLTGFICFDRRSVARVG